MDKQSEAMLHYIDRHEGHWVRDKRWKTSLFGGLLVAAMTVLFWLFAPEPPTRIIEPSGWIDVTHSMMCAFGHVIKWTVRVGGIVFCVSSILIALIPKYEEPRQESKV